MGVIRSLKVSIDDRDRWKMTNDTLDSLGQQPFYPPDVGGWPKGRGWLTTQTNAVRAWAAEKFADWGDLSTIESAGKNDRIDAVGYLIGIGSWSDRTVAALKPMVDNPVPLVTAAVNSPEYLTV
jgi:hypothetical protein